MTTSADSPNGTISGSTTASRTSSATSNDSSVKVTSGSTRVNNEKTSTTPLQISASNHNQSQSVNANASVPKTSPLSPPLKNVMPPPLPNVNISSSSSTKYIAQNSAQSSTGNAMDSYRSLLNRLTMGLIDWLKFHPNVTSVKVSDFKKADKSDFSTWEQKHMCILPEDLKAFYSTINGLNLTWSISMTNPTPGGLNFSQGESRSSLGSSVATEKDAIPVGLINVNPVNKLIRIAGAYEAGDYGISLADIDSDEDFLPTASTTSEESLTAARPRCPHFNERSRIFELDYVDKIKARVCLVYKHTRNELPAGPNPEIWLLDRSLSWHFLASDFTTFFRLMIVHLGLPEWQFLFTNVAVSQKARQWFNFFAPTRLQMSGNYNSLGGKVKQNPNVMFETPVYQTKFDAAKVFKAKSVRLGTKAAGGNGAGTQAVAQQKKKPDVKSSQSTTPASGSSNLAGKGSSQALQGSQRAASAGNSRRC